MGLEPVFQPRRGLAPHALAGRPRSAHRKQVQELPAAPSVADAGLVPGLPGPRPGRPQAQPAHQGRAGACERDRCAGPGLVAAAMNTVQSQGRPVELDDVQGLVRFGYRKLTEACFLLLCVKDPAAARAWLAQVPITTAVKAELPRTALQVAFTSEGLCALELAPDLCAEFSAEFVA